MKFKTFFKILAIAGLLGLVIFAVKKQAYPTQEEVFLIFQSFDTGISVPVMKHVEANILGSKIKINPVEYFKSFAATWRRKKNDEDVPFEKTAHTEKIVVVFVNGRKVECEIQKFTKSCWVEMEADAIGTIILTYVPK